MSWLVSEECARSMRQSARLKVEPTAEQVTAFHKAMEAQAGERPRNLAVDDKGMATIRVEGVLTKKPNFWAMLFGFGGTTYADIQQALAIAKGDAAIKGAQLIVDSPGGAVDGLFDTLAAIEDFTASKPLSVVASNAQSAAYAIASAAGKIQATGPAASFGSIGVAIDTWLDEDAVSITNRESPDKRPDLKTDEGKAVVQDYLDSVHELFADAIARGRGTTVADVNKTFGRGATLLASDAKKRGMVDSIAGEDRKRGSRARAAAPEHEDPSTPSTAPEANKSATDEGASRERPMDLNELKAKHPGIYEAAVQEGVTKERTRVNALIKVGKSAKALDVAHNAIASGKSLADDEVQADFMSARFSTQETAARTTDEGTVAGALNNAPAAAPATKDIGDLVADAMGLPPEKPKKDGQ